MFLIYLRRRTKPPSRAIKAKQPAIIGTRKSPVCAIIWFATALIFSISGLSGEGSGAGALTNSAEIQTSSFGIINVPSGLIIKSAGLTIHLLNK